ncbi:hypothetical protein [Actinacidiphila acidipaludis]|uniref:Uncharacterized protein n=1 Tax=Actinacidiphila acidipaludis TaxID=2873382 RepID=A0ABS7Q9D7_9ACTN|nr:hypothetical protein [Streptomyces acidipaludis]MBY8879732.1 hypothetical protein [Streptomyces acidipaludis]
MPGTALVRRPTEDAAIRSQRPLPPVTTLLDLHLHATATQDRYGARLFACQLDRALGGVR